MATFDMDDLPELKRDELPGNSHKQKAKKSKGEKSKKVVQVVKGGAVKQQKGFMDKVFEFICGDDASSIFSYVWDELLVPAAKNTIFDIICGSAEMRLFHEVRGRTTGKSKNETYVSYNNYYKDDRRERRGGDERTRSGFQNVVIKSLGEAKEVREQLIDYLETYDIVSVAEFYDMVGVTSSLTDNKWGWDNLRGVDIKRVRDGYILTLPKPFYLDVE